MQEDRLTRIENKLDDLQMAVVSLARVEERLVTVFNRQTSIEQRVSHMDEEITKLSDRMGNIYLERMFWVVFAAAVTFLSNYFGG